MKNILFTLLISCTLMACNKPGAEVEYVVKCYPAGFSAEYAINGETERKNTDASEFARSYTHDNKGSAIQITVEADSEFATIEIWIYKDGKEDEYKKGTGEVTLIR